jgi:hypothetical protein
LTFKNKFFIIALENHISNGGFALNYFKQIYLMEQQDIPQETLTFNLTPRSAVLIPKTSSEYTGQGTPKTATFNAKIHIVDATSTSEVSLVINEIEGNITNAKISYEGFSTSTTINQRQNRIKIGNASNGKFLKKMNIELQYTTTTKIEIWGKYKNKEDIDQTTNSVKIQVNY